MSGAGANATGVYALVLVAAAFLIAALTVVVTTIFMRQRIKARIEDHIEKLYTEIDRKAAAAAAGPFTGTPQDFFDLVKALNNDLGPLIKLGGPLEAMVSGLKMALNSATMFASPAHPTPDEGISIMVMPNPPTFKVVTQAHRSANAALHAAADDFYLFWHDKTFIKQLLRDTLHKLTGNEF